MGFTNDHFCRVLLQMNKFDVDKTARDLKQFYKASPSVLILPACLLTVHSS